MIATHDTRHVGRLRTATNHRPSRRRCSVSLMVFSDAFITVSRLSPSRERHATRSCTAPFVQFTNNCAGVLHDTPPRLSNCHNVADNSVRRPVRGPEPER